MSTNELEARLAQLEREIADLRASLATPPKRPSQTLAEALESLQTLPQRRFTDQRK